MGVDGGCGGQRWRRAGRRVLVAAAVGVLAGGVQAAPARAAPSNGSAWTWPLAGPPPVTRGFAPPQDRYGAGHRGVDLGGALGVPVLAAGAGRVSYAGLLAGRGVVVVQHGELRTTYEPVTAQVTVGQQVAAGEPLGRLDAGHGGCPAAACLHWGLRQGERYLDPLSLVGAGPVRLLPVLDPAGQAPLPPVADRPAGIPAAPGGAGEREGEPAPAWALRSAVTPTGALALVALLAGLAVLGSRRPRPDPGGSAAGTPAVQRDDVPAAAAAQPPAGPPEADVVDLCHERSRRRASG